MGYCYLYETFSHFLFSINLNTNVAFLMVMSKFKKLVWLHWCSSLSSSSVGYISEKNPSTSPPSFIDKESSLKHFVEWECQAFTLCEEIRDEICPSSFEEGRKFAPSGPGTILTEIPTDSCICNPSHFKAVIFDQMIYSGFEWYWTILKWSSSFLTQKCGLICRPSIKVLVSSFKCKINDWRKFIFPFLMRKISIQGGKVISCDWLGTIFVIYIVQWLNYGIWILEYPEPVKLDENLAFLKVSVLWVNHFKNIWSRFRDLLC